MGFTQATYVFIGEVMDAIAVAAEVAGAVYTAASVSDAVLGTDIVTPDIETEQPQLPEIYNMGGPSFKDPTPAYTLAEGFNNYLDTLIAVAPTYVGRYRPDLRDSYSKAISKRRSIRAEDEVEMETQF
jgi:hypothetical protein